MLEHTPIDPKQIPTGPSQRRKYDALVESYINSPDPAWEVTSTDRGAKSLTGALNRTIKRLKADGVTAIFRGDDEAGRVFLVEKD
jgi:hypothetical protein